MSKIMSEHKYRDGWVKNYNPAERGLHSQLRCGTSFISIPYLDSSETHTATVDALIYRFACGAQINACVHANAYKHEALSKRPGVVGG